MKNIVWLAEWFPSIVEPYSGDGIERRAKAVSQFANIHLVHVKKRDGIKKVEIEEKVYNEHFKASIYYYPSIKNVSTIADFILSNYYFFSLHSKALNNYRRKNGKPAGIQVNVTMKCGLIALYYKLAWGVKYIVAEGWSLFLPEAKPWYAEMGRMYKAFTKRILKNASMVTAVSSHLGKMIQANVIDVRFQTIPSAVDTNIFYPIEKEAGRSVFRFIHISTLNHPKNFEQILYALQMVLHKGFKIELVVYGPERTALKKLAQELQLKTIVDFRGEAPQTELAAAINQSDALLLYSRYETFGNVIIEANACGVPVIVSDYPSFNEIIKEGENGLTATANNVDALADKMVYMIQHKEDFNASVIAQEAKSKYNFERIGRLYEEVYDKFF